MLLARWRTQQITKECPLPLECAAIFGSANISEYEANKTGFIRLFSIEANWRILHEKLIKMEANIFKSN
jgi:hypothetical protein